MMFWLVFVLFLGLAAVFFVGRGSSARRSNSTARSSEELGEDEPIEALKQRYVAGEIDLEEFETRAKRLYETEGEYTAQATNPTDQPVSNSARSQQQESKPNPVRRGRRSTGRGRGGCGR